MKEEILIPEGIEVQLNNGKLVLTKEGKTNERVFNHPMLSVKLNDNKIILETKGETRNEKRILKTSISHIKNMIKGFLEDFEYKLKICYKHFPMSVENKGTDIVIKNFLGEKKERRTRIFEDVKIEIKGDTITLRGHNIEHVAQSAANIENATRITGYDRRIFQDGIFIIKKHDKKM